MFKISVQPITRSLLLCVLFLAGFFHPLGHFAALAASPDSQIEAWDNAKYISIDEIRPGMEAYCLTVYKGTDVEKFELEVLDVARSTYPWLGHDIIFVKGTSQRFIETGPVGGCSGSPVYIDGRLAGALAWAWQFSKEPVYGVTPIAEMLAVSESSGPEAGLAFDFSRSVDFEEVDEQLSHALSALADSAVALGSGLQRLPCPLIATGLPTEMVQELETWVKPLGLMPVVGMAGGGSGYGRGPAQLVPGACLTVPLVVGDMKLHVIGTVTEVVDDKVYGFGHGLLSYGPIDLPLATGYIHTVFTNVIRSFKFGEAAEIVGALTTDESTAVYGKIGAKPRMIPLTIRVSRYNAPETRLFDCHIASNRVLTPGLLRLSTAGAAQVLGRLPPEHSVEYEVAVALEGGEEIVFENLSTGLGLNEMTLESTGVVALLMNNPYHRVGIESIEIDIGMEAKSAASRIWSVDLRDTKVKAGDNVEFEVVVESFLADKKKYRGRLEVPEELPPGKYDLLLCGGGEYLRFLRKAAPHRFIPENLAGLVEALKNIVHIKRDRLYCLLILPPGGMTLEKAQLPDLPATKMLVLHDAKRTLTARPYQRWVEKSLGTGTVIIDKKQMKITIEE
ncbi:MAG: hypothetical protein ACYTEX_24545 [Planctomycetota bacterium]|jgi:hypothetical protein